MPDSLAPPAAMAPAASPNRLNLGAGAVPLAGYHNLDRKLGHEIFPLSWPRDTVDEIRASHVLEHFPHGLVPEVLADWVRALKPGGVLKIAVPDFAALAAAYLTRSDLPIQGYVMGGQVDAADFHKALFDRAGLDGAMRGAGLIGIRAWTSEAKDCASLPISLNLMGVKPVRAFMPKIRAVMSVPRLGFMDNFFCAFNALAGLKIPLAKFTGAFWGQCLTRAFEKAIAQGAEYILTIDYDTIYTKQNIRTLIDLAVAYPEIDALAPLQSGRGFDAPLFTVPGKDGLPADELSSAQMRDEIVPATTANFGLTLIKAEALKRTPKPWLWGQPDAAGGWGGGRIDDDMSFWKQWAAAGNKLFLATRVVVGHAELMIRWPGPEIAPVFQTTADFADNGPPAGIWKG